MKFDHEIARQSLRFYKHQDISKIDKINIPRDVYEVKFKCDLTNVKEINLKKLSKKNNLFQSL